MRKNIWPLAIIIGVANAIVLYIFEFIGVDVTFWLWNDVLQTDSNRWLVLPVAVILGLGLAAIIKILHGQRVAPPDADLMAELSKAPSTIPAIGVVMAIGAMSLLAGGSIGPEASLMTASAGIGLFAAHRWKFDDTKQLLMLASTGALLVAFVDSMVLALIPLLMMFQEAKKRKQRPAPKAVAVSLLASVTSFLTIRGINYLTGESGGYGTAPPMPDFKGADFLIAILLGFVSGFVGLCLVWLIAHFGRFATWLDDHKLPAHDWIVGAVFGLGLGALYLLGGPTIQFSGSIGSGLLVSEAAQYGALALVGLVVTKVLATAWSKGTSYRGGLVFPSIYVGVALGLLAGSLFSGLSGAGALVGGISGMMTAAVGSPAIAGVFLISVLPVRLWPVGLCAITGTTIFTRLGVMRRFLPSPK